MQSICELKLAVADSYLAVSCSLSQEVNSVSCTAHSCTLCTQRLQVIQTEHRQTLSMFLAPLWSQTDQGGEDRPSAYRENPNLKPICFVSEWSREKWKHGGVSCLSVSCAVALHQFGCEAWIHAVSGYWSANTPLVKVEAILQSVVPVWL